MNPTLEQTSQRKVREVYNKNMMMLYEVCLSVNKMFDGCKIYSLCHTSFKSTKSPGKGSLFIEIMSFAIVLAQQKLTNVNNPSLYMNTHRASRCGALVLR